MQRPKMEPCGFEAQQRGQYGWSRKPSKRGVGEGIRANVPGKSEGEDVDFFCCVRCIFLRARG